MRPAHAATSASVETPDPAELTAAEVRALERAAQIDSGSMVEQLADKAHDIAYRATVTPDDLRELAAMALTVARRSDVAAGQDD